MNIFKSLLKMILGFVGGALIGLLIAAVGLVCFTDTTFPEYFAKLQSAKFGESMLAAGVGIVAFFCSVVILIPLHEAGHLVCGLLSGYRFISFRIFNLTFIRSDGKLTVKQYAVAGTGGQCLLEPPDLSPDKIHTAWYNFGGVLANILVALIVAPLLLVKGHPFVSEFVVVFLLVDMLFILINGVPMKIGGVGNDVCNMIALRKSMTAKRGLITSLRANALIQQGVTPAHLPAEWFATDADIDYGNDLEVSLPLMAASRTIDEKNYAVALEQFEDIYRHKKELNGLYVKEIECELVFLRLMCGDTGGAADLLTPALKKYIDAYRKTMSSKERLLCAISLKMDNDRDKALEIYNSLLRREEDYLMQGEVKSDLAIMKAMLQT